MRRHLRRTLLLLLLAPGLSLADDTAPPELSGEALHLYGLALDHWIAETTRLQRISQELRVVGAPYCSTHLSPVLGLTVLTPRELRDELQAVARQRFGDEDDRLQVVSVFDASAAARAGVLAGDVILSIDGKPADRALRAYRPETRSDATTTLGIERDGEPLQISTRAPLGCEYPARLSVSGRINAYATGRYMIFPTGILRAMPDDSMLALIVGHELAHNLARDPLQGRWDSGHYTEARADYVGAYLAAMAGYAMPDSRATYGLMVEYQRELDTRNGSHPSPPFRALALRKTLSEIEAKQSSQESLTLE